MKLSNLDYHMFLNQRLQIAVIDSENRNVIATTAKELDLFIEKEVRQNISETFFSAVDFELYSNDRCNTIYCHVTYENSIIAQFMAYSFLQANTEAIVIAINEAIDPVLKSTIQDFEQKEIEGSEIQYLSDIKNGDYPNL